VFSRRHKIRKPDSNYDETTTCSRCDCYYFCAFYCQLPEKSRFMSELVLTSKDVLARFNFIRTKRQEYFVCLSLDSRGQVITRRVVTIGLLDVSLAHPREVFAGPLKDRAAAVIVAHNHPSGNVEPSMEDIETTQQLIAAGKLLGMPLRDHIIVTKVESYSFRDSCLM
jgi:DNA repair protein RadC